MTAPQSSVAKQCEVCRQAVEQVRSDHPFRAWAETTCAACRVLLMNNARMGL